MHAPRFLIVAGEVFDAGADAFALYAAHGGGGQFAAQQRVFGIVFVVASAERRAHQIHAGREDDVNAVGGGFIADGGADFLKQRRVPTGRQAATHRKGGGVGFTLLAVAFLKRLDSHAGRSVGHHNGWNAKPLNGMRHTSGAGHSLFAAKWKVEAAEEAAPSTADDQLHLFFVGHLGEQRIGIRRPSGESAHYDE